MIIFKKNSFFLSILLVNLTLVLFIFRIAIPYFKYPFIFLYILLILYSIFFYFKNKTYDFSKINKEFLLIFLNLIILVVAFSFSVKIYPSIIKEIVNTVILLSILFLSSTFINNKHKLRKLFENFLNLVIIFSLLISFNHLLKILNIFSISQLYKTNDFFNNSSSLLTIDNNFAAIPALISMIIIFYKLTKEYFINKIIFYNISLILLFISVLLSSSIRANIVLYFIVLSIVFLQIFNSILKVKIFSKLKNQFVFFILSISILFISSIFIILNTSYSFKNSCLKGFGSRNLLSTKLEITHSFYKYYSVFDNSISFSAVYDYLWTPVFNSYDPESSWGTRNHKSVFPLSGRNVDIVPSGSIGYLLDSTCNASFYNENNISEAYSLLVNLKVKSNDKYVSTVYCYVSQDFNGENVAIGCGWSSLNSSIVSGITNSNYNMNERCIWKKLEIEFSCDKDGEVPIYISFIKRDAENFSKLKGFVIFAYPTYRKIDNKCTHLVDKETNKARDDEFLKISNNNRYYNSIGILFKPNFFLLSINDYVDDRSKYNLLFGFNDADTTFYGFKTLIDKDSINLEFGNDRISRWKFAIQIFQKEYNCKQKFFGSGFKFLNWYGYYFLGDKKTTDYPHNPFLHILLYSGIVGVLLYILLLYKVFYYYIKYIKEYYLFFIFFLITYFFTFFSGGNPFDPPIMGFFMMLPFFIHYIHEKDKPELEKQKFKFKIQGLIFKIKNFRNNS